MFLDRSNVTLTPAAIEALEIFLSKDSSPRHIKCLVYFSRAFEQSGGNRKLIGEKGYVIGEYRMDDVPISAVFSVNGIDTAVFGGQGQATDKVEIDHANGGCFTL